MGNPEKTNYLDGKQCLALSCKVAAVLNGVTIGQAQYILNEARHIIYDCHAIDTGNPRFKAQLDELAESGVSKG